MKNIILTGSGSGFGLLAAQVLAKHGHKVYATMRNVKTSNKGNALSLKKWAEENNALVHIVELDVTNQESIDNAIREISADAGGKIDVLINNAGMGYIGLTETLSYKQINQLFQINVMGANAMIKAVLPFMRSQKEGLLITLSSVAARLAAPTMGAYSATKAAVDSLSLSYYHQLKSFGIDVAIVQPGAYPSTDIVGKQVTGEHAHIEAEYGEGIRTAVSRTFSKFEPSENPADPAEVADVILDLVEAKHGERKLWSVVGAGPLTGRINQINQLTQELIQLMSGTVDDH